MKYPNCFPPPKDMAGRKFQVIAAHQLVNGPTGPVSVKTERPLFTVIDDTAPYVTWALSLEDGGAWEDLLPDYLADDGAGHQVFSEGDGAVRFKLAVLGVRRVHWTTASPARRALAIKALREVRTMEFAVSSMLKHADAPVVTAAEKQLEKFIALHREQKSARGLREEKRKATSLRHARHLYPHLRHVFEQVRRKGTGRGRDTLSDSKWLSAVADTVNRVLWPSRKAESSSPGAKRPIRHRVTTKDLAKLRTETAADVARAVASRLFQIPTDQLRYKKPRSRSKRAAE